MSDSVRPHGQQPTRLLCPGDSPGKSTGVGTQRTRQITKKYMCWKGTFQDHCCLWPCPCGEPLLTCLHRRPSNTSRYYELDPDWSLLDNWFPWLLKLPSSSTNHKLLEDKGWAYVTKKAMPAWLRACSMKEPSDFGQSQAGFLDSSQGRHTNPDNVASNGQNSKDPQPKLPPNHQDCHLEPALRCQDAFLGGRCL